MLTLHPLFSAMYFFNSNLSTNTRTVREPILYLKEGWGLGVPLLLWSAMPCVEDTQAHFPVLVQIRIEPYLLERRHRKAQSYSTLSKQCYTCKIMVAILVYCLWHCLEQKLISFQFAIKWPPAHPCKLPLHTHIHRHSPCPRQWSEGWFVRVWLDIPKGSTHRTQSNHLHMVCLQVLWLAPGQQKINMFSYQQYYRFFKDLNLVITSE